MTRTKFNRMLKQVKLTIHILFWVRFIESREITAVILIASKHFNVGMHSDIDKATASTFAVIMVQLNSTLYALIQTQVTSTLIQGEMNSKKQIHLLKLSQKKIVVD